MPEVGIKEQVRTFALSASVSPPIRTALASQGAGRMGDLELCGTQLLSGRWSTGTSSCFDPHLPRCKALPTVLALKLRGFWKTTALQSGKTCSFLHGMYS